MKLRYIILLCVSILCIAVCVCLQITYQNILEDDGEALESLRDSIKEFETNPSDADDTDVSAPEITYPAETDGETAVPAETESGETTTASHMGAYIPGVSLDFEKLWKMNPEICGWLDIDGTRIDYPVLQSPDDDKKYLNTAYDGTPYIGGALFTEATYNSTDFNDPVTVIYGHTMRSGMLFGQLQKIYSSASGFAENSEITLYLPGEVRQYTVFAAVPYDNIHILHTYDFSNVYWYNSFFTGVRRIRAIGANFDKDTFPKAGDRVLILSVCLNENTAKRYLVMAVLDEDLAADDGVSQEE